MADYTNLELYQQIIMLAIALLSHLITIPLAIISKKQINSFIAVMGFASMISSLMYHCTEIFNVEILMEYGSWHRLDNIFVITGIQIFILLISGYYFQSAWLKFATIFSNIFLQRIAPWDVRFSILPIFAYIIICFGLRIANLIKCNGKSLLFQQKSKIKYHWGYAAIAILFIMLGSIFYYIGLDEKNDYLRLYHSSWHFFGWFFVFFGVQAVTISPKSQNSQNIELVEHKLSNNMENQND